MKVDSSNFISDAQESSKSNRAVQGEAAGAAGTTVARSTALPADQTSFSSAQGRVQALSAKVLAQPEVREAKVQALQQAISEDRYSVSPGQIADALAKDVTETYA